MLACLGCEPDSRPFWEWIPAGRDGEQQQLRVIASEDTCDGLYNSCRDAIEASQSAASQILSTVKAVAARIGATIPQSWLARFEVASSSDACTKLTGASDCKTGICAALGNPLPPSFSSSSEESSVPFAASDLAPRLLAHAVGGPGDGRLARARRLFAAGGQAAPPPAATRTLPSTASPLAASSSPPPSPPPSSSSSSSSAPIVYTSTGYPVFESGCGVSAGTTELECPSQGNDHGLSAVGGVGGLVGIILGTILFVAVVGTGLTFVIYRIIKEKPAAPAAPSGEYAALET
jgi:hypothetical protein